MKQQIEIRITGTTGKVDGYAELILGMFALSGILVSHKIGKKVRAGNTSQIYIDAVLAEPPLGHLGETDIPVRED